MSKTLQEIEEEINKKFGKGTVFNLSSKRVDKIPVIPSGILGLDAALGVGGFPLGRIAEIFGAENSGKSGIALSTIAQAQKMGKQVVFIDAEHSLNIQYCERLGVDVTQLLISQPSTVEEAFTYIEYLLSIPEYNIGLIVVDSFDALETKREADSDIGDANVSIKAKVASQIFRRLTHRVGNSQVALIVINQVRDKVGFTGYGETSVTTGGRALKFYASVRLEVKKIGLAKDDGVTYGHKIKVEAVKNKVAPPYIPYEYEIIYADSSTKFHEIIKFAIEAGFIKKGGAWFTYEDEKWQGESKLKDHFLSHPELVDVLEEKVKGWLGLL